jgi:tetratricopeptide (TPR) repeat protein
VIFASVLGLLLPAMNVGCHHGDRRRPASETAQDWERLRAQFKLRLASDQLEQGHVLEAMATLQKAATLDTKNPAYHQMLARCYLETSSPAEARNAILQAERLGAPPAPLAYLRGILAERQSDYEEALRCYRKAVELVPANVDYRLAVAECLVSLDRAAEAKAFLDDELSGSEGEEQLTLLRAQVHLLLDDLEAAAADFEAAEGLLAGLPWLAEEFGLVLVRLGRYAEGMALLRSYVESASESSYETSGASPASGAAVRGLATCYNRLGTPENARELMEDHLRRSPQDGRGWWILAESLVRLGDLEEAQRSIDLGKKHAPRVSDWRLLEAYLAWKQGDADRTTLLMGPVIADRPDDALAHWFLVRAHENH